MNRKRLKRAAYAKMRTLVLQRDGMRCQICGRMQQLEVHHLQFRSRGGTDNLDNLVAMCSACHRQLHLGYPDAALSCDRGIVR